MSRYDFSDLIDLSGTKDLTTIPDPFTHDSCLTHEESERKGFLKPVTEGVLRALKNYLTLS